MKRPPGAENSWTVNDRLAATLIRTRSGCYDPISRSGMRYWWVNQSQTHRQEIAGGYLWSPKRNANGAKNHFYETMREVAPGDLIFSFVDTRIAAIGIARSYCWESPKPSEFGSAGQNWEKIGWRVAVAFTPLLNKIRPKDHIDVLRSLLPGRYSPLQANGNGIQSVYLTEVPENLAETLVGLIGPEATLLRPMRDKAERNDPLTAVPDDLEQWEGRIEADIRRDQEINETEREALVRSRRGQGLFKQRVMLIETRCRITHVDNLVHLVASHCKPWRDATNEERLNGENGLLLTPSIDHLFDRGFIGFEDSGDLIISPVAHRPSLRRMGIETEFVLNVGTFTEEQRRFLDFHRDSVLLRAR
jgi:putative restriction endonuclease